MFMNCAYTYEVHFTREPSSVTTSVALVTSSVALTTSGVPFSTDRWSHPSPSGASLSGPGSGRFGGRGRL